MTDKFTLEFSLSDFDNMNHTSMASFHIQQEHRFETCSDKPLPTSEDGMIMYWMGPNDLTAIVGEKILIAAGYEVHRLWDFVENPESEWCLLTNYRSSSWAKQMTYKTYAENDLLERFKNQLRGAVNHQLGHNKNRYVCDDRLDAEKIAEYLQTDFLGPFPFNGSDTWWVWEEHTAIEESDTTPKDEVKRWQLIAEHLNLSLTK